MSANSLFVNLCIFEFVRAGSICGVVHEKVECSLGGRSKVCFAGLCAANGSRALLHQDTTAVPVPGPFFHVVL